MFVLNKICGLFSVSVSLNMKGQPVKLVSDVQNTAWSNVI